MSFPARYHKARKQHYCDWCGEIIKPGEKYLCQFQPEIDGGTMRLHTECEAAMYRDKSLLPDDLFSPENPRGLTMCEYDDLPFKEATSDAHQRDFEPE